MNATKLFLNISLSLALLSSIPPSYAALGQQDEDEATRADSLRIHPPSPWQMANLRADYEEARERSGATITFPEYISLVGARGGCVAHANANKAEVGAATAPSPVSVPTQRLTGELNVMVLLLDFPDLPGRMPREHYQRMLFSERALSSGSMREYYNEVSAGKLKVTGSVVGWVRMPQAYSFYTNNESGMQWGSYPRNAPRMAEDAVNEAMRTGVRFEKKLDALGNGNITALFLIHAGRGAEGLSGEESRNNIWSHKWGLRTPIQVAQGLRATTYLTVPRDCMVGVCAHELGHLAMGWDDFYDANYDQDGQFWDGSGNWDLMAGGSWAGGGMRPVHPVGHHKLQHGWVRETLINVGSLTQPQRVTLAPMDDKNPVVVTLRSPAFRQTQCLRLENRRQRGFDSSLPGEGLLVWRVDTSREQISPNLPALLLVQADGLHQLEKGRDNNAGDAGDPFPGTRQVTQLLDSGNISTSFPGTPSGIALTDITRNARTGEVSFTVSYRKGASNVVSTQPAKRGGASKETASKKHHTV